MPTKVTDPALLEQLNNAKPAAFPGVIQGRPKVATPPSVTELERLGMERQRLQMSQEDQDRQTRNDALGSESERTAGFLAGRIVDAVGRLAGAAKADPKASAPTLGVEAVRSVLGDTAANYLTDAERQQVRAAQLDIIDSALTLGTGAAYTPEQLENYRTVYFPQLGDDPATIASKRAALRSIIVNAQTKAGKAAPDIDGVLAQLDALSAPSPAGSSGEEWTADKSIAYWGEPVFDQNGNPLGPDGGLAFDAEGNELGMMGATSDNRPGPTEAERLAQDPNFPANIGDSSVSTLARQGITLGLSDEAAGIGTAIGHLLRGKSPVEGYNRGRAIENAKIARAREQLGWGGTALEVVAGGGGVLSTGVNLGVRAAAKAGAGVGALGGFGYGEGLEGRAINTAGGAVLGGVLGGGAQAIGNRLAGPVAARADGRAALGQRAVELDAAGRAERVTVNRAMVDPSLANRVTGADATITGGRKIQRDMTAIEGQIEGRVDALGRGGTAMDNIATGDTIRGAGERFITKSGKAAKRKYDRAENLAGGARVEPKESLRRVDDMLSTLRETPETNAAEIGFLEKLRSDFSAELSVGALRRMRTSLRKRISRGELVFGEDEARVLAIMDGAADDIRTGLTAQGKREAADAFDAADKAYRARMEYVTGTVQKLIGKRGATPSSEQIAAKFQSMTRTDAQGLRKFYASLTPEERADVSATFAEQLGRNNKGEFSVAHFLSQTAPQKMSDEALRTVFGDDGAQSIRNLRVLGREVNRVTGSMNSRTSKTAVANNYKDWLINGLLGAMAGGGGAMAGGGGTALAAGSVAVGANALRNAISARALMSPNITKWLRQAPSTTSPAAINKHFARLGEIAKAEPALAGDIQILRDAIMNAANDNASTVTRASADDAQD